MKIKIHTKQCCSCESVFDELTADNTCPECDSGNWVNGYIDDKKESGGT